MDAREIFLFLHIASVLALAAGVGVSVFCKVAVRGVTDTRAARALLATASGGIRTIGLPASLAMIATGVALVAAYDGAYEYHEPWIVGALVLWLGSAVVGARMHAPRSRAINARLDELEAAGSDVDADLLALVRGGRAASILDTLLLAGMVGFMVFKPTFGM